MSGKTQSHFDRFQRNASLADRFENSLPADLDWCCVIMFYAALHLLHAYLSTKTFDFEIDTHAARWRAIYKRSELKRMGGAYRELQDVSEQVRYDPGFDYKQKDHSSMKANLRKVIGVVQPLVQRILQGP